MDDNDDTKSTDESSQKRLKDCVEPTSKSYGLTIPRAINMNNASNTSFAETDLISDNKMYNSHADHESTEDSQLSQTSTSSIDDPIDEITFNQAYDNFNINPNEQNELASIG